MAPESFPAGGRTWAGRGRRPVRLGSRVWRLFDLVYLTSTSSGWTSSRLAAHYGVSRRRIFDDLRLLNRSGIPLVADRKGYRPLSGPVRLPVTLTVAEVLALLRPCGKGGDHRETAQAKLAALLPEPLRALFRNARKVRALFPSALVPESIWDPIERGLVTGRRLRISYRGLKDVSTREREVDPEALFMKGTGWYLVGWVDGVEEPRLFRLDRMEGARVQDLPVVRRQGFDLDEYLGRALGVWIGGTLGAEVEVMPSHVRVLESEARARGLPFHRRGEGAILEIPRGHVDEVAWWLAQFGEGIRVLFPQSLRNRLKNLALQILKLNGYE